MKRDPSATHGVPSRVSFRCSHNGPENGEGLDVLAAALALDFRPGERTRTTKDMDLVRGDKETAATSDLISFQRAGKTLAVATIGRDLESLENELAMEQSNG